MYANQITVSLISKLGLETIPQSSAMTSEALVLNDNVSTRVRVSTGNKFEVDKVEINKVESQENTAKSQKADLQIGLFGL